MEDIQHQTLSPVAGIVEMITMFNLGYCIYVVLELQENSWTCGWRYLQLSSQTVGELSVRLKELGTYTPIEFNRRPSNQSNQKLIDGKQQSFSTLCCVQGLCLGIAYQESSMITLFSVAVHLLFKSKSSTCHLDPLLWPSEAEASLTCMIHKLQLGCINVCSDVCEAFEDSRCY